MKIKIADYSFFLTTPRTEWYKILEAGEMWKIGETIQFDTSTGRQWRYSESYLNSLNVRFVPEYTGPKAQIVFVQQMKLAQFLFSNGNLPPGNKGLK